MGSTNPEKVSIRDRVRGRLKARGERRVERGEVGRHGVGDNSGFSSPV